MFKFIKELFFENTEAIKYDIFDSYDEGFRACEKGEKFYENPYSIRSANPENFLKWFGGWCAAKNAAQDE